MLLINFTGYGTYVHFYHRRDRKKNKDKEIIDIERETDKNIKESYGDRYLNIIRA